MHLPPLENIQVSGKRVLVRIDAGIIQNSEGGILSDLGLKSALPTLEFLLDRGSSIIILSSLKAQQGEENPSLAFVCQRLSELLKREITFFSGTLEEAQAKCDELKPGRILFLENLLLYKEEEECNESFGKLLSSFGDIFVNEAFGDSVNKYASLMIIPEHLPSYTGFNVHKEYESIRDLLVGRKRPLVFLLGGVGLALKIKMLTKLFTTPGFHIDNIMFGGGLSYTFMKSRAVPIGTSFKETGLEVEAFQILEKAALIETEYTLPTDHIVADQISRQAKVKNISGAAIPDQWRALDIGPKTIAHFEKIIKKATTLFWYGPMGAVEIDRFAEGTKEMAKIIARSKARSVVIGECNVKIIQELGLESKIDHLSLNHQSILDLMRGVVPPALTVFKTEVSE